MANNILTKTELEIMHYLWSINSEVTARDIRLHFASKDWSKQTVSTFLKKLSTLGYVNVRKVSLSKYYYSAAITESEYNLQPARAIMKEFFSGSLSNFICALAKPILNDNQSQQLNDLITKLENESHNQN